MVEIKRSLVSLRTKIAKVSRTPFLPFLTSALSGFLPPRLSFLLWIPKDRFEFSPTKWAWKGEFKNIYGNPFFPTMPTQNVTPLAAITRWMMKLFSRRFLCKTFEKVQHTLECPNFSLIVLASKYFFPSQYLCESSARWERKEPRGLKKSWYHLKAAKVT